MGCDIHLYTEKRKTINGNKTWICVDHFKINEYFGEEDESHLCVVPIYDHRDYALFGVLAGVRDYYGNEIIDKPRGLPEDVTDIVKKESDDWGSDGHSHSWLTARELFDYKRNHNTITYSGLLSQEQIEDLENGINPDNWCQGSSNKTYERRTWTEEGCALDSLIDAVKKRMSEEFWIWDFYDDDKKAELFDKYADDFRIVFWFDN